MNRKEKLEFELKKAKELLDKLKNQRLENYTERVKLEAFVLEESHDVAEIEKAIKQGEQKLVLNLILTKKIEKLKKKILKLKNKIEKHTSSHNTTI